jgi:hypothetical protein
METAFVSESAADALFHGLPHPESVVPALLDMRAAETFAAQHRPDAVAA